MIIQYGSYPSEQKRNKYFYIVLNREDFVIKTTAVVYPHSLYLGDVSTHTFSEDGNQCCYSPTGFCRCYDQIKSISTEFYVSPKITVEMLIERLEKVVPGFTSHEIAQIREMIYHEVDLFENEE